MKLDISKKEKYIGEYIKRMHLCKVEVVGQIQKQK